MNGAEKLKMIVLQIEEIEMSISAVSIKYMHLKII